jgi:hypothetical protein
MHEKVDFGVLTSFSLLFMWIDDFCEVPLLYLLKVLFSVCFGLSNSWLCYFVCYAVKLQRLFLVVGSSLLVFHPFVYEISATNFCAQLNFLKLDQLYRVK